MSHNPTDIASFEEAGCKHGMRIHFTPIKCLHCYFREFCRTVNQPQNKGQCMTRPVHDLHFINKRISAPSRQKASLEAAHCLHNRMLKTCELIFFKVSQFMHALHCHHIRHPFSVFEMLWIDVFQFPAISSKSAAPLKRSGPTIHKKQTTT